MNSTNIKELLHNNNNLYQSVLQILRKYAHGEDEDRNCNKFHIRQIKPIRTESKVWFAGVLLSRVEEDTQKTVTFLENRKVNYIQVSKTDNPEYVDICFWYLPN